MDAAATSCTTCRNAGELCSTDDTDAATRAISGGVIRTGATSGEVDSASIISIAQRIAPHSAGNAFAFTFPRVGKEDLRPACRNP